MLNSTSLTRTLMLAVLAGGWLGIAEPALASLTALDAATDDAADAARTAENAAWDAMVAELDARREWDKARTAAAAARAAQKK